MDIESPIKPANSDKAFNTQRSTPMKTRSQANKTKKKLTKKEMDQELADYLSCNSEDRF